MCVIPNKIFSEIDETCDDNNIIGYYYIDRYGEQTPLYFSDNPDRSSSFTGKGIYGTDRKSGSGTSFGI